MLIENLVYIFECHEKKGLFLYECNFRTFNDVEQQFHKIKSCCRMALRVTPTARKEKNYEKPNNHT